MSPVRIWYACAPWRTCGRLYRIDFRFCWCVYAPMSDWDDYRLILALARTGTLRAAANDLEMTHTTVSRRLAVIEDA
ncbi:MAG: LysR family transcriptional regulator, partial [Pseudomonadota bacterium]